MIKTILTRTELEKALVHYHVSGNPERWREADAILALFDAMASALEPFGACAGSLPDDNELQDDPIDGSDLLVRHFKNAARFAGWKEGE